MSWFEKAVYFQDSCHSGKCNLALTADEGFKLCWGVNCYSLTCERVPECVFMDPTQQDTPFFVSLSCDVFI